MSATITATGTWTPLNVDLTKMSKLAPNVLHADLMQLEQLKGIVFPEIGQFIQAMADGYGIGYQPAKALFDAIWHAEMNRENPRVSPVYQP
jgi:hypothetical protein